jgi:hypothetical protein
VLQGTKCTGGRTRLRAWACALALLLAFPAHADFIVPAGATTKLASGVVDLACTDLVVGGTVQVQSGAINNVRNVTIQSGGTLDGGSGVIQVGGNWSNSGSFSAGTGEVDFRDLCGGLSATVSGNTTFSRASFVSNIGKNYVFAVGSTQTILSLLQISGTAANPIQFRSSASGQVAFINLVNGGTQQIQHVGVTDVWATGQCLAPGQANEGGGGNAKNWFVCSGGGGGGGSATPNSIPALDTAGLVALAALLAASGMWLARRWTLRRRRSIQERADAARSEDRP